jgi:hypothetical protein
VTNVCFLFVFVLSSEGTCFVILQYFVQDNLEIIQSIVLGEIYCFENAKYQVSYRRIWILTKFVVYFTSKEMCQSSETVIFLYIYTQGGSNITGTICV